MRRHVFIVFSLLGISVGYSQSIHHRDSLTLLTDSLIKHGWYKRGILLRKQAMQNHRSASWDYQLYLKAKFHHAKSCDYEFDSYSYYDPDKAITKEVRHRYLDSALQSAIKARDLLLKMEYPDRVFQYQVQSRIYHQTAYLGDWRHALEQAQLGYTFLKDTLKENDKILVDWISDFGHIYSKLGDYSKSVDNYQKSIDLYRAIIGEDNYDVGLSYHNIAVEYRKLGLKKMELESLLKAQSIWEQLPEASIEKFLYFCYGNLFSWYSYYGDFEKAEGYLNKQNKLKVRSSKRKTDLLFRNREEFYENELSESYDLMLHYSRKKDSARTVYYANKIVRAIPPDKQVFAFETQKLSATLKFHASYIEDENPEEALALIEKAIALQKKHKDVFYTKAIGYQFYRVELLFKSKKYKEAQAALQDLNTEEKIEEISDRFKQSLLLGKTFQGLKEYSKAHSFFDTAFSVLNTSDLSIEDIKISDLKPLVSFETILGFLDMGDFYYQRFQEESDKSDLKKATHRYFLASRIYNQLYLGQRYNERLFETSNEINERLLTVGIAQPNDKALLSDIINTLENNGSKLIWSRFVYNNRRQEIALSADYITQEENIKAQLNFYQNALVTGDKTSEEKTALWKNKIFELKDDLAKIQDSIKLKNNIYYQLNVKNFDVIDFQKTLKDGELVLKYVMTDQQLYTLLISKLKIQLRHQSKKSSVTAALRIALADLKQRTPKFRESFETLQTLLFDGVNLNGVDELIILPDGALHYFPLEALIFNKNMPDVSYASSLLLCQEQRSESPKLQNFHIGAFSASNNNYKLPKASNEILNILKFFSGQSYLNASKKQFLENCKSHNVLHLAMHSTIDEVQPELSSLNFYGDVDNKLFISDLYNESLDADLAVLSACDTGSGFYENGEGVISLSRAFSYAGVPSTVMSLWKVDDEATSRIMTYFYSHLKNGQSKDKALKNAKYDYLKNTDDELLKHPYYWSGFVISGNTDALMASQNSWVYLSILPIMMLGIFRKRLFQFFKK